MPPRVYPPSLQGITPYSLQGFTLLPLESRVLLVSPASLRCSHLIQDEEIYDRASLTLDPPVYVVPSHYRVSTSATRLYLDVINFISGLLAANTPLATDLIKLHRYICRGCALSGVSRLVRDGP